jgi:2-oxo-4-hydroxy-4-carboxy-5-ureidoimidazoline decarboxylase
MTTVTLESLNASDRDGFVAALGDIYEHAPWVARAVYDSRPFASLAALDAAMRDAVRAAAEDERLALIKGHPDLAGKAARAGTMTTHSVGEQASAGLDRLSEAEFARFHQLNDAYRARFNIPFIVCVRRHGKDSILRQFEQRLRNAPAQEAEAALTEIFRIAALRLDQRVTAANKLPVNGHLSTHVLDTRSGRPAEGVSVTLLEVSDSGDATLLTRATTNRDGRTEHPLIAGRPLPIARYELRFDVGAYFSRLGVAAADPAFLDVVPIRFSVAEPEGHYHVPLLVTPWSYTTYRGS